jgi:ParB family chromosome partitioning protein
MGKLDQLLQATGANIDESMGADRRRPMHGASPPPRPAGPDRLEGVARSKNAAEIPVGKIVRDEAQPREDFDEAALARLAGSLKARGQLQPIRVRWDEGRGAYVVIVGERRWRAAAQAGLPTLTAIVHEGPLDPAELLAVQLVENALREDLRPVEQARAYRRLMESNGWSGNRLAQELSIDQSSVARALALLEAPAPVRELVEAEQLAPSVAYEISKVPDRDEQAELARRAVAEGLNRAEVVAEVRRVAGGKGRAKGSKGRGAARKVTERILRVAGGKVTVENRRGLDAATIRAMLLEALGQFPEQADTADAA